MTTPEKKPARKQVDRTKEKGARRLPGNRLMESGLTVEQEAYCRGRAMGMSVAEALKAADCKVNVATANGWENLNGRLAKPQLVKRINELAGMAAENAILKSGLDREWVITRLMNVVERCMEAAPVLDGRGNHIEGQWTFDAKGANTALRSLGDTLGMFRPLPKNPDDDYAQLTDEELARLAIDLAAQAGLVIGEGGADAD